MNVSGMQTVNSAEVKPSGEAGSPQEEGGADFSFFLDEMQNRGMAQIQLTLLPGGKVMETVEEVKGLNMELKEAPIDLVKTEEENIQKFKNESLEDLKGEKVKAKLESSELFLSQREASKAAGKNQGLNSFSKIFNIKKDKSEKTDEGNVLSLLEAKNNLGEAGKTEAAKTEKVQFGNTKELFNWISKVIAKNAITKGQELNLTLRDGNLGQFNIIAQKLGENGQLGMQIHAQSEAGRDFFKGNEALLTKALENAGMNVSEFKVQLAGSRSSLQNDMASLMSDSREAAAERMEENMFQREDLDQDSRRRQRIWEEMLENRRRGA
jgi:hypothetical protein